MNITIGFGKPKGEITIHSVSGIVVKTIEITSQQFKLEVDLEDLKSGIYFYTLKGESGEKKISKIVLIK